MEELEAAAAVLAMANDSDDEEPRVAVDLSTSTAADTGDGKYEGEPLSPDANRPSPMPVAGKQTLRSNAPHAA